MKIKPKEVMVSLPMVVGLDSDDEISRFAANFNIFLHGKVKMKCEVLGLLAGKHMGIFYLQRNDEFSELRNSFMKMIEAEELENSNVQ
jgi:hypothetical protein